MAGGFVGSFLSTKFNHTLYGNSCSPLQTTSAHSRNERLWASLRRKPHRFLVTACVGDSPKPDKDPNGNSSNGGIAKRIEQTFIEACIPGTKPYVEALGDFVRSALDAYTCGYNLTALQFELQACKDEQSRNLKQDEVELRSVWLTLVYKTLREIAFPVKQENHMRLFVETYDRLDDFVKNVVGAVRLGYDMKRIQLEQTLVGGEGRPRSPIESAILNQSLRLVLLTLSIAKALGGNGPAPNMPESL